jgi:hypothetical protein
VEDVLEKYWNAHRMDYTLQYLIQHEFASPFDFFQEFGDYWEERGWQKIGHQLEDLFIRLQSFLEHRGTERMDRILGLMKYDYYLNHRQRPRKVWWNFTLDKKRLSALISQAIEQPDRVSGNFKELDLTERDMHKHAVVEVLPFDLEAYLKNGEWIKRETALFAVYRQGECETVRCYTMVLEPKEVSRN